ncbi:MAG: hypothetical protein LIO87_05720, partial [Eubacterium sp.]|nr:hypothetical protein [Eubacterium sp.]
CMSLSGIGVLGVEALADTTGEFSSIGGWYETAYATWSDSSATSAKVYYKTEGADDSAYVQLNSDDDAVDTSLTVYDGSSTYSAAGYKNCVVRQTDSGTARVDIMGIGWGNFDIKVVASDGTTTYEDTVTILEEDRSGYAHFGAEASEGTDYIGAYTDEGVLKDNATVIYVTEANKNTVTWSSYTGIGNIASHIYTITTYPIDIRFLGEVDTTSWEAKSYDSSSCTYNVSETAGKAAGYYDDYLNKNSYYADTTNTGTRINNLNTKFTIYTSSNKISITTIDNSTTTYSDAATATGYSVATTSYSTSEDTSLNMMDFKGGSSNSVVYIPELTIEGVGTDTVAKNWGISLTRCTGTEVRNMHFVSSPEDACSATSSYYVWIHRCTFDVGANHCDLTYTTEQDKHEGDGSTDFNLDTNVTCSYNVYNNCHKTSLNGGSDSTQQFNYTYHHNYYNSCNSRLPLTRFVNVHLYNNYTYGASTAVSARASAFVFSEYNTYDNTTNVFKTQDGSSTYGYGKIKSYNDTITNCTNATTGISITTASSRTTAFTIGSGDTNQHTSDTYNDSYITDFDTNSTYFYYDSTNQVSDVSYLTSADEAVTYVTAQSGVLTDSVTYTDIMNASSDSDDDDDTGSGTETDGTITSEQTITADNYTTSDYFTVDNPGSTGSSGVFRLTNGSKVSFTTGIDGAKVTVVGAHANSNGTDTAVRTLTLYDDEGTEVTDGAITYQQGTSATTETIPTSSTLSAGSYYLTASKDLNITSITVSFPGIITDTATLTFTNSTDAEVPIIANSTEYSDYFTLLAADGQDSSNKYTQSFTLSTKSSKTFADYVTYDYCIKSGGSSDYDSDGIPTVRAIKFTTSGAGVVQLYGIASSDSSPTKRYAYVYDSKGTAGDPLGTLTVEGTSNNVVSEIIELPSAGTYYITFYKAVSLYAVNVKVGASVETDNDGNGYIFTDSSDSYIVAGTTISDSDFENYSDMTVTVTADSKATASTETVYAAAVVDDFIIQPSELGDDYTYVYVVQVKGSGGATDFSYSADLTKITTASDNS